MICLKIRRRVPSGNKSTFGHWSGYRKERDIWYVLLRAALVPKDPPHHRVKVRIVSHRVSLCDKVNFMHGAKCILDGLVKLGFLRDDSIKWVDDEYDQKKAKRVDERTIITLVNP